MRKTILMTLYLLLVTIILSASRSGTEVRLDGGMGFFSETKENNVKYISKETKGFSIDAQIELWKEYFVEGLYLGVGTGWQNHQSADKVIDKIGNYDESVVFRSIPIYFTTKYHLIPEYKGIEKGWYPYLKFDAGYSINIKSDDLKDVSLAMDDGLYFSGGIGAEFDGWITEIAYKYNSGKVTGLTKEEDFSYSRLALGLGYRFNKY